MYTKWAYHGQVHQVQCASRTQKSLHCCCSTFITLFTQVRICNTVGVISSQISNSNWAQTKCKNYNILYKKLKEYTSRKSINSSNSMLHIGKLCLNNCLLLTNKTTEYLDIAPMSWMCVGHLYIVLTLDNISNLASKLNIIEFQKHDHRTTWLRKQKMIHCQNHFYQKMSDFSDIHQKQALEKTRLFLE